MKKIISIVLMCTLVITLFAGCGSSTPAGTRNTLGPDNTDSSTEGVSVNIWTNFSVEAELLQKYADKWAEKTGNKATVTNTSIELEQFAQAANTPDGPDGVFGVPNDKLSTFAAAGLVAEVPADFYNDGDYVDAAVQSCYYDGKRYSIPIAVETITLFYNTDKVKTPPKTWDELLGVAKTSGGIKFEATSIYYDLGFLRAFDGYIFKWENGKYYVDDIGLGNAGAVHGYKYIRGLADEGFITADITFDISKSSFEQGETAFYIGGPWDVDAFTSAGVNFAVAEMPALNGKPFVTPVGTQVAFVSSKTSKKDAVLDLYRFLIEEASAEMYETGARIPAKVSIQQSIQTDEITEAFMKQIANGEPLPSVPELGYLWTPYADNMRLMFSGKITPEEAAQYIESQFREAIELMHSGQ